MQGLLQVEQSHLYQMLVQAGQQRGKLKNIAAI